jgi:hypothetical protein
VMEGVIQHAPHPLRHRIYFCLGTRPIR